MIPNDRAFNGKIFFEYDGKIFYRWHHLKMAGNYTILFRVVSTKSEHKQGIALFFSDFAGSIFFNGEKMKPLKGFQHYVLTEDKISSTGIEISVQAESGYLFFGNGAEDESGTCFKAGAYGCAFWIEIISDNHLRFHCNDYEYDDDFDDFVFDLEINQEKNSLL